MSTINQLIRRGRDVKKIRLKAPALKGAPVKSGVVLRVYVMTPKKPNSAKRCVCRVRLTTGMEVTVYVPGEKNRLQPYRVYHIALNILARPMIRMLVKLLRYLKHVEIT